MWIFSSEHDSRWYDGIEDDDYHKIKRLSSSIFKKHLFEHPLRAYQEFTKEKDPEEKVKDSLRIGKLIHMLVLEPEKFDRTIIIEPKLDKRTTIGKEEYAKWKATIKPGQQIIDQDDFVMLSEMKQAIHSKEFWSPQVRQNFDFAYETSGFAVYRDIIPLKIRPDIFSRICPLMMDIKSCEDVLSFDDSIVKQHYMVQAAFYCIVYELITGTPCWDWRWIALSKKKPFETMLWTAPLKGDGNLHDWKIYLQLELDEMCERIKDGEIPTLPEFQEYKPKPYMTPIKQITGGYRPWETK